MNRILDLEFVLQNFRVGWDEVTAEESAGLKILKEERSRYQEEIDERRKR